MKKQKNEDSSKLVTRKDPIETILAEFNIELRHFLDEDYQVSFTFKSLLQQQIDSNIEPIKPSKKTKNEHQVLNEIKKLLNENPVESLPLPDPFQCSIQFQLQQFISQSQII
jgi:hypothetical protein